MSDDLPDETTRALVAEAERARQRVAADVRVLAKELTTDELKERALDAAERSVERIGARALQRLAQLPRWLAGCAREHPLASGLVAVGTLGVIWAAARHRR